MDIKCRKCEFYLRCKFKKPTIEQLKEYANSIGWPNFDAEYFYWKQEQLGWMVKIGNTYKPMASWKGAIQTWKKAAIRRGEIKEETKTFKERFEETKNEH